MTNRKRPPYRTVDRPLALPGPGNTQDVGFIQTAQGAIDKLKKRIAGLQDRLRYKYAEGVPQAYSGQRIFVPETQTMEIETARIGENENGVAPAGTSLVQYVVRDGITHTVPVIFPGPGVFIARFLVVTFYQRIFGGANNTYYLNNLTNRVMRYSIPFGKSFFDPANAVSGHAGQLPPQTGKVSLLRYTRVSSLGADRGQLGINFFWNLVDGDSQRQLSDGLIPHDVLLPQGFQAQVSGNLFEFGVPWLFERGGRVDFQFRLINPILQLAAADPEFPFVFEKGPDVDWDDREQNGTVRNQQVMVRVELHGTKFYSERDRLLREAV